MPDNNFNASEIVKDLLSRANSLCELTESSKALTELVNAFNQEKQRTQDEKRKGYLMQRIFEDGNKLGISSREHPPLKSMTVSQLEDYIQKLSE